MRELLLILKLQHDTFYWLQVHYSRARSESRYVQLAKLAQQVDKRVESCVIILVQASCLQHHPSVLNILDIFYFSHYDVTKRKLLLLVSLHLSGLLGNRRFALANF